MGGLEINFKKVTLCKKISFTTWPALHSCFKYYRIAGNFGELVSFHQN